MAAMGNLNATFQAGLGAYQWWKGNQLEKDQVRPTYEIPEEMKNYLSAAEVSALQGLPDAQKQQYLDNVSRSMTSGLSTLGGRGAGIQGVSGLVGQANDANRDLLTADASARMQNQRYAQQARKDYAQYEDKVFDINKMDPYYQNMNRALALQGAGQQNVQGGLNSYAQVESQERSNARDMIGMMYGGV